MGSMSESLFSWVGSLTPFIRRNSGPKPEDFKDGVMLAKILKEVVDPDFFRDLKTSPSDSTPLIHLTKRMRDYLSDQVGHRIPDSVVFPNVPKIMTSGDIGEISRLLQLLLVCAVNSPRREEFISSIRKMETSVQTEIVAAIQEIMEAKSEASSSAGDDDVIELKLKKAQNDISALLEDKERLSQECHELTQKMSQMVVEKTALLTENEKLQSQYAGNLSDPESIHMSIRVQEESKREIEQLRERNYELEAIVDDFKVKNQVLQKQISETHFRMASAASAEEEVVRLKDEMDSLREAAAKTSQYEKSMKQLQKRLEEMGDLKQNLKLLEEKNVELMKVNFSLSDENKKILNFKNQTEALKKDLTETQQQLSQEKHNANKANFDCNKMREKLETEQRRNQTLLEEKNRMADMLEELRLNGAGASTDGGLSNMAGASVDSIELLPPLIRQKLVQLEMENKKLHDDLKTAMENDPSFEGSKILVEQLRKHEEELDKKLLAKSQELIDVKANLEDRMKSLEAIVASKDEELRKKELQYKKCMEKAQSVIKTLEPTHPPGMEKSEDLEKSRSVREMEDKLLQSAFYHYGIALHHKAVETRNRTLLGQHRQNVSTRRRSELQ